MLVIFYILEFQKKPKLHLFKLYFDTSVYDRITKHERANFETRLSVVGGTMGLFSGFSLISGMEIVYYICKVCMGAYRKKRNKKI